VATDRAGSKTSLINMVPCSRQAHALKSIVESRLRGEVARGPGGKSLEDLIASGPSPYK